MSGSWQICVWLSSFKATTSKTSRTHQRYLSPRHQDAGEVHISVHLKLDGVEHIEEAEPEEGWRPCWYSQPSGYNSWAHSPREASNSRGGSTHNPQPLIQWCPQPQVAGKQWQCGLRSYPSSCKDPHDSCPLHPIYNSRGHEPYNTWQSRGIHVSPAPTDSPQPMWWWSLQLKGSQSWWKSTLSWRPREWRRQHWQQQGNNDHGGKRSNYEVVEQHLWQRQWEVECQIYLETAQVKGIKNLCYNNTYWKTKEKPGPAPHFFRLGKCF